MLDQIIWWGGTAVEIMLLVRGAYTGLFRRYSSFYCYLGFVLAQSLVRYVVFHGWPDSYAYFYWSTEILSVLIGCAVVFEIYRVGLEAYPGTARIARLLLFLLFAAAILFGIFKSLNAPGWWAETTVMELERALRLVQALALVVLISLFLMYSIPFGRNLRGILFGYSLFVACSLFWLSFVYKGSGSFQSVWFVLYPALYCLCLCVWLAHLWSYSPQPSPARATLLEQNYQEMALLTRRRLDQVRSYVGKALPR